MDVNNLHQKVNSNTGASGILNLFLVNKGIQIIDIHKCEDQLLQRFSNHSPIEVTFNIQSFSLVTRQNIVKGYSFCNGDYRGLSTYMIQNKFDSYCLSNPNKVIELWYQWLNSAIEKFIPKRTLHRSSLPPWITKETSHLLNCLKTARKKMDRGTLDELGSNRGCQQVIASNYIAINCYHLIDFSHFTITTN